MRTFPPSLPLCVFVTAAACGGVPARPTRGPIEESAVVSPPAEPPPAASDAAVTPAPPAPTELTLVLVGDVGLNRNGYTVDPRGVVEGGSVLTWEEMSPGVAPLLGGDLVFMNLETVVTDRNDLGMADKGQREPFGFRTHPAGVRHLLDLGFNLVSAANNHAYDFGAAGVLETIRHLEAFRREGRLDYAGIGANRDDAARPIEMDHAGMRVAFSAIGIVTNNNPAHRAGPERPGTLAYRVDEDWQLATTRFAETPADYRILSIHYGTEREIHVDARQLREWRSAVRERGVDLVVGHHAHVVRGVERNGAALIFYGLGNFLHRGTRDMSSDPALAVARDYGLLARVHVATAPEGRLRARAVEVVPIRGMHRSPQPFDAVEGRRRIEVLNALAAELDDSATGAVGLRFQPRADGTGLYCFDGAAEDGGRAAELCRTYEPAPPPPEEIRRRVALAREPAPPQKLPHKAAPRRRGGRDRVSPPGRRPRPAGARH